MKVMLNSHKWEERHGALQGLNIIIEEGRYSKYQISEQELIKDMVLERVLKAVDGLSKDSEYRVR